MMLCKVVYALFLVASIEARFLGSNNNYQLPTVTIPQEWVLQMKQGQLGFAYPDHGETDLTVGDAVGNAVGNRAYITPESELRQASSINNFRESNVLSDELPIAPVINLVGLVPADTVSHSDVVKSDITTGRVRLKRKNVLRYRNGEFRPTLCSPRLCLSDGHFDQ